ncbi:MAG TPA: hypothetical protein VL326_18960 [Kofleriaceae bacterium]|jgi:hypothetical protein|nr:hypothetical protein [Kofleriaceae bacterium]
MKRALAIMALIALTSSAHADDRTAWKVTFASAVAVDVASVAVYVYARHQRDDAQQQLCDGGAYHQIDPTCTSTPTLTQAQVDQLNDQGDHARTMGRIAMVTTPVFAIVAGVAFYEGFIKRSSRVTIAPDVSKDGAGAALQIRW